MTADPSAIGPMVQGFTATGFRIDGRIYRAALLTVARPAEWLPPPLGELTIESLQPLLDARPEFVLLGTGARLVRPSSVLTSALDALNIGLEAMDSRAAARAWGVLRGEGRNVGAALYPLD